MIDYDYENKPYYSHRLWLKSHKNIPSQYQSHPPPPWHPVPIHHGFMAPTWRSRRSKHSKPVRKVLISSAKTWLGDRGSRGPGTGEGWWFVGFFMVFWHPNMPMTWGWGWGIGLPSGAGYRILTASVRIACPTIIVAKLDIFHSSSILGPFGYASQCR